MRYRSKLIKLLNSFDATDWRECGDFIKGQVRKGHECIKLYEELKSQRKELKKDDFDLKVIKHAFYNEITDKSFTNLLSKLSLLIEDYLAFYSLKKDQNNYKIALLKELSNRGLYEMFEKRAKVYEHQLNADNQAVLFHDMHLIRLFHLQYFSDNPIKNVKGQRLLDKLKDCNKQFHDHYDALLNIAALQLKEITRPAEKASATLSSGNLLTEALSKMLAFKKAPSAKLFEELDELLHHPENRLSEELRVMIIELLIHQAHSDIRKGDMSSIGPLMDLYEFGFTSGLLLSNKVISENRFINVVVTACAAEEYKRAKTVIDDYNHLLLPETRSTTIQISQAHLLFYQEMYAELVNLIKGLSIKEFRTEYYPKMDVAVRLLYRAEE